jgi:hypothetical protein
MVACGPDTQQGSLRVQLHDEGDAGVDPFVCSVTRPQRGQEHVRGTTERGCVHRTLENFGVMTDVSDLRGFPLWLNGHSFDVNQWHQRHQLLQLGLHKDTSTGRLADDVRLPGFFACGPSGALNVQTMHELAVLWILTRLLETQQQPANQSSSQPWILRDQRSSGYPHIWAQHRGDVRFNGHLVKWQTRGSGGHLHDGRHKRHRIEQTRQP